MAVLIVNRGIEIAVAMNEGTSEMLGDGVRVGTPVGLADGNLLGDGEGAGESVGAEAMGVVDGTADVEGDALGRDVFSKTTSLSTGGVCNVNTKNDLSDPILLENASIKTLFACEI
jgi:hypothetical protein